MTALRHFAAPWGTRLRLVTGITSAMAVVTPADPETFVRLVREQAGLA